MVGLGAKPTFISLNPLAHFSFYNFSEVTLVGVFLCGEKLKILYSRRVFFTFRFFHFFLFLHFFTFFTFSDFCTFLHFYIFTTFRFFHFFYFFLFFSPPVPPLSGYPGDMKKISLGGDSQSSPNPILLLSQMEIPES